MKILFLYPDMITPDPSWRGYFYEGIAMLSAAAREAGHETELLHVYQPLSNDEILTWVQEHRDGDNTLLAFSGTANQFPHIKRWAPFLKEKTGLATVVGGMHATLSSEDAISPAGIDMICCGDGEAVICELATRLARGESPRGIQGLWFKNDENEVIRQSAARNTDVDTAPIPHWEIYRRYEELEVIREGYGILVGSRGCPYNCAYCCNLALIKQSKLAGEKYLRFKSVRVFVDELKTYLSRYPKTVGFFFEDDIFGVWKKWLVEFVPVYKKEIGMPFGCNLRPNMVNQELIDLLKEAGCGRVHMAIEAGSEEVRNRILNRNISREKLVSTFGMLKAAGIKAQSYNIVGSPHETARQILETLKINAEIDPEWMQHSIFYPYEGTPLYDLVHREGLVSKDREVLDYFSDTVLEQDCIQPAQIVMFQKYFKGFVRHYKRMARLPKPARALATKVTDFLLSRNSAPKFLNASSKLVGVFRSNGNGSNGVPKAS